MNILDFHASDLLEGFLVKYNDLVAELNTAQQELTLVSEIAQKADQAITAAGLLDSQVTELTKINKQLDTLLNARTAELKKANELSAMLRVELNTLKSAGIERLKEQNKRLKSTNEDLTAKNGRILKEKEEVSRKLNAVLKECRQLETENLQLGRELSHNQGTGIWHKGEHHLIVWPQIVATQDPGGKVHKSRPLLYMHTSGRGGLITYDPINGATLSAAPKGGLKPSADALEHAATWLYKVNELQKGAVTPEDMACVNFNGGE